MDDFWVIMDDFRVIMDDFRVIMNDFRVIMDDFWVIMDDFLVSFGEFKQCFVNWWQRDRQTDRQTSELLKPAIRRQKKGQDTKLNNLIVTSEFYILYSSLIE